MSEIITVGNGTKIEVFKNGDRDRPMFMSMTLATTESASGEKIEIVHNAMNPFHLELRGTHLSATLKIESLVQEAILHILRENIPDLKKLQEGEGL